MTSAADDPGVERGIPSRSEEIARIVGADVTEVKAEKVERA